MTRARGVLLGLACLIGTGAMARMGGCAPQAQHESGRSGGSMSNPGFELRTLGDAAHGLRYSLYTPPPAVAAGYRRGACVAAGPGAAGAPLPLILFLHGRGECGTDGLRQMINGVPQQIIRQPDKWRAIVIMPQKPDADRPWIDYEDELLLLIERACDEFDIDRSRIYLTGLSQGGAGTWALAAAHPKMWAAIAPVCGFAGDFRKPNDGTEAVRIGRAVAATPTWTFHGEADSVVPIAQTRAIVDAMKGAGGSPRFTAYPGVNHGSWEPAYAEAEFTTWLFAQQRGR
ncbi:MAG: dienelactone hydrolase family protein [Phycisphaerales bacterium]